MSRQLILPPPQTKASRDPHTPPPLLSMLSLDAASWPLYGHLEITQAVRLKSTSNRSLHQFMKLLGCGENRIQKFSCFSARKGACCTGLPAGLPIKENPGEPGLQSAASDRHHHTPRGHNLNYTIWILESESSQQCHSPVGAPCQIYQANLGAQHNSQAPALLLQQQVPGALLFPKKETGRGHTHFSSTCFLHV